jgi:formylglycine-generating enzyme required for sulfatase activity
MNNSGLESHPAGTKAPNPWGLYDMYGNAWEWCLDWYGPYPGGRVTDPRGPAGGTERVVRGGGLRSRNEDLNALRSANRHKFPPMASQFDIGFRVVLAPELPGNTRVVQAPSNTQKIKRS